MGFLKPSVVLLLCLTILCFSHTPALAIKKSYIVYMGSHAHVLRVSEADLDAVTSYHHDFLASFLGSADKARDAMFYSYTRHINGFAAMLEEEQAAEIAKHPKVVSVFPNQGRKLHTTHSWDFMQLEHHGIVPAGSIWKKARFGQDVIIANLDTGVWPESKSFSDEGFGPIPSKWKGICQNETVFSCNRKLIGGRYFNQGYIAAGGSMDSPYNTPRDFSGHGSHTLSTAAGNFVPAANVYGLRDGTAKGGSPKARVATYKICWEPVNGSECFDADIIQAFDTAIHDGVDVISMSVGGPPGDYFLDGIAIGGFHAVKHGIVLVCSAGNDGPQPGTVSNVAPWMITVGASTHDREIHAGVKLHNGKRLKGRSLSEPMPKNKLYPLITGKQAKAANASAEDAMLCKPRSLDAEKVKGNIVVCLRGENARVEKGHVAALAGAAGMILCNDESTGNDIVGDPHVLPASHVTYADGLSVFAYINSTSNPLGYIFPPRSVFGKKPSPAMADFSSIGPNTVTPEILKPDITAPGVRVIAAYSEAVTNPDFSFDKRRLPFNFLSGTSMSCPHVSGVAGLLKTLHPDWSPAAIRSAIMTTARTRDNTMNPIRNASNDEATPFNYGAGHIRPNRAQDPGLVYDMNNSDYLEFLCALGFNNTLIALFTESPFECPESVSLLNFNYPSMAVPKLSHALTLTRKLKNVGSPGTYAARVKEPYGISVIVEPSVLVFENSGDEKSFTVTLEAKWPGAAKDYKFGRLIWEDGKGHYVRSPIAVATAAAA